MRKITVLLLALLIACCPLALADELNEVQVDVDFEGEWWDIKEYGYSIYLPTEWVDHENTESDFIAGAADGSQMMKIDFVSNESAATIEALYDEFLSAEDYENVAVVYFNAYPYVVYDDTENDAFGAVTLTNEGQMVALFTFWPNDEATSMLATKIMVSLVEIDMDAAEEEWIEEDEEENIESEFSEEEELSEEG